MKRGSHPHGLFLSRLRQVLLGRSLLQFVVAHRDDRQNQIHQIIRSEEDDEDEEQHVPGTRRPQQLRRTKDTDEGHALEEGTSVGSTPSAQGRTESTRGIRVEFRGKPKGSLRTLKDP